MMTNWNRFIGCDINDKAELLQININWYKQSRLNFLEPVLRKFKLFSLGNGRAAQGIIWAN